MLTIFALVASLSARIVPYGDHFFSTSPCSNLGNYPFTGMTPSVLITQVATNTNSTDGKTQNIWIGGNVFVSSQCTLGIQNLTLYGPGAVGKSFKAFGTLANSPLFNAIGISRDILPVGAVPATSSVTPSSTQSAGPMPSTASELMDLPLYGNVTLLNFVNGTGSEVSWSDFDSVTFMDQDGFEVGSVSFPALPSKTSVSPTHTPDIPSSGSSLTGSLLGLMVLPLLF